MSPWLTIGRKKPLPLSNNVPPNSSSKNSISSRSSKIPVYSPKSYADIASSKGGIPPAHAPTNNHQTIHNNRYSASTYIVNTKPSPIVTATQQLPTYSYNDPFNAQQSYYQPCYIQPQPQPRLYHPIEHQTASVYHKPKPTRKSYFDSSYSQYQPKYSNNRHNGIQHSYSPRQSIMSNPKQKTSPIIMSPTLNHNQHHTGQIHPNYSQPYTEIPTNCAPVSRHTSLTPPSTIVYHQPSNPYSIVAPELPFESRFKNNPSDNDKQPQNVQVEDTSPLTLISERSSSLKKKPMVSQAKEAYANSPYIKRTTGKIGGAATTLSSTMKSRTKIRSRNNITSPSSSIVHHQRPTTALSTTRDVTLRPATAAARMTTSTQKPNGPPSTQPTSKVEELASRGKLRTESIKSTMHTNPSRLNKLNSTNTEEGTTSTTKKKSKDSMGYVIGLHSSAADSLKNLLSMQMNPQINDSLTEIRKRFSEVKEKLLVASRSATSTPRSHEQSVVELHPKPKPALSKFTVKKSESSKLNTTERKHDVNTKNSNAVTPTAVKRKSVKMAEEVVTSRVASSVASPTTSVPTTPRLRSTSLSLIRKSFTVSEANKTANSSSTKESIEATTTSTDLTSISSSPASPALKSSSRVTSSSSVINKSKLKSQSPISSQHHNKQSKTSPQTVTKKLTSMQAKKFNTDSELPSSRPTSSSFDLHECQYCQRKFSKENDRHSNHEKVCATAKQKEKKRETRREKQLKEQQKKEKLEAKFKGPPAKIPKKDWRQTHDQLIAAIRAAKEANIKK